MTTTQANLLLSDVAWTIYCTPSAQLKSHIKKLWEADRAYNNFFQNYHRIEWEIAEMVRWVHRGQLSLWEYLQNASIEEVEEDLCRYLR